MRILQDCFVANRNWAAQELAEDPEFFRRLTAIHRPEMLWIGCSDARLPPNEIIGRRTGELFVHRNVANLMVHSDLNSLSVLQYAVEVLKVRHVIVCGHYGCGGIETALDRKPHGLIDNWLRHVRDVRMAHDDELEGIVDPVARVNRLAELNVKAQVANVCHTTIVQDAWSRGQSLAVHGWIYALSDGLLRDLGLCIESPDQIPSPYQMD
ncbi:MAG TPA: carbonic anhydrase [Kofleriaceae bacterium]|nr:carbonic anhydrase [Kofleriaceae bacterium]